MNDIEENEKKTDLIRISIKLKNELEERKDHFGLSSMTDVIFDLKEKAAFFENVLEKEKKRRNKKKQ
jgi:galactitol-specific phosphotransferase system IIB component